MLRKEFSDVWIVGSTFFGTVAKTVDVTQLDHFAEAMLCPVLNVPWTSVDIGPEILRRREEGGIDRRECKQAA